MTRAKALCRLRFTVEGTGTFPLDMLRYDCCWPVSQQDVAAMDYVPGQRPATRKVDLVMCAITTNGPACERWSSFGWSVVPESLRGY
jgi:hypothetical protein